MKPFLAFVVLAFVVAGCSQPASVPAQPAQKTLELQFGTAGDDSVNHVAVNESGIYVGGQRNSKPALVKFSRTGRIPWTKSLASTGNVLEVALSSAGDVYALYRIDDARYAVRKYTQDGTLMWTRKFSNPSGVPVDVHASAVDAKDNIYLSFSTYGTPRTAELRKYSSDGNLLYRKQLAEPVYDLDVTPGGTTYTVSGQRLTRYTSQGRQVWQKTLPFRGTEVALGTSSQIYVGGYDPTLDVDNVSLAKYSSSGSKSWQRTVRKGFFSSLRALDADTEGNVFVGVEYHEDPYSEVEVYFYSYNAAGTRLAKRLLNFGGSGSSNQLGEIKALSSEEVYVGGTVVSNSGDDQLEGFLARLNGLTGTVTWQR